MDTRLLIGGELVAGNGAAPRRRGPGPRGETIAEVGTRPDAQQLDAAIEAAREAQREWAGTPAAERAEALHEVATRMRDRTDELAELLTLEGGKPRIENLDEVEWCAACFDYYGEIARNSHGSSIPPVAAHQVNFTIKEPLGVVGCIVPFNYPLLLMTWKVAPAIAAGNTVVIKPSELTPLSTLRLCETAWKDLPAGVVNVVTGTGADIGEPLIDDPDVACIAFTGSTAVGTRIAVKCAEKLKRVNLELGGIDPLIVFEDADLDVAVRGAAWARYLNAGQVCTSAKRIYVVDAIAREFVDRFVAHTKTIKVGHGMDPEVDMGPLISAKARDRVEDQVKRAVAQGAKVLTAASASTWGPAGSTRRRSSPMSAPITLSTARRSSDPSPRSRWSRTATRPSPSPPAPNTAWAPTSSPGASPGP